MYFPVIIHKEDATEYGITVPDFPGVFSGGETLEDAVANVQDALEAWYCDESVCRMPTPSNLEAVLASADAAGGAVVLVDVDPGAFGRKQENLVNAPLPAVLLERLDRAAARKGQSRAEYLAALLERDGA